jgi:hypothetical protein
MIDHEEIVRLREAFAAETGTAPAGCVPPEAIWAASRGAAPPAEVREVIEHTAICASCAEGWRLAVAFCDPGLAAVPVRRPSVSRLLRLSGLAAAAVLIVAVGGTMLINRPAPPERPVFRQAEQARIDSRIGAAETLPRDRCELRWTPVGPPGTTYAVTVSTPDLRVVASAKELAAPAFQVPAATLAGLPSPATLLWRVDATLPDGPHLTSPTFTTTVE